MTKKVRQNLEYETDNNKKSPFVLLRYALACLPDPPRYCELQN